ncbi:MAG: hypothetical protein GEU88_01980 [Solirubrobacterales bacterium]|nr:hypothetical protein [Solirubrobacterales bacterium]
MLHETKIKVGRAGSALDPGIDDVGPPAVAKTVITGDGEGAIRAEIERLERRLDVEMAERLRDAREFGEPAGNDELLQIREEEAVIASRVARLRALLANATVVDDDGEGDVAAIGTAVEVEDAATGKTREYQLVGGFERLTANAASAGSPLGQALIGRTTGAEVQFELPNGRARRLRIVAVRPAAVPAA